MEYKDMGEKIVMIEDVINKKKQEIQSLKLLLEEKQQCIRELQNNLNNQVPALPI